MPRIVPFVDHEIGYRLLQQLVAHHHRRHIEIPVVVTTRENGDGWWPGVLETSVKAGLPLLVYDEQLSENHLLQQVDWFLLLSWKHIIPPYLANLPRRASINLHYSLLPFYKGVYPVNWVIANGEKRTGFTYHFVNESIDEGEIFMQVEVPVRSSDTARSLQSRMDSEVINHFEEFLNRLLNSGVRGPTMAPPRAPLVKGTYYSREMFERARRIDLQKNYRGEEFLNLLRGMTYLDDSRNAFFIDDESGKRIYLSLKLMEEQ